MCLLTISYHIVCYRWMMESELELILHDAIHRKGKQHRTAGELVDIMKLKLGRLFSKHSPMVTIAPDVTGTESTQPSTTRRPTPNDTPTGRRGRPVVHAGMIRRMSDAPQRVNPSGFISDSSNFSPKIVRSSVPGTLTESPPPISHTMELGHPESQVPNIAIHSATEDDHGQHTTGYKPHQDSQQLSMRKPTSQTAGRTYSVDFTAEALQRERKGSVSEEPSNPAYGRRDRSSDRMAARTLTGNCESIFSMLFTSGNKIWKILAESDRDPLPCNLLVPWHAV